MNQLRDKLNALLELGVVIIPDYITATNVSWLLDHHNIRYRKSYYEGHRDSPPTYYIRVEREDRDNQEVLRLLCASDVPLRGPFSPVQDSPAGAPAGRIEVPFDPRATGPFVQQAPVALAQFGLAGYCLGALAGTSLLITHKIDGIILGIFASCILAMVGYGLGIGAAILVARLKKRDVEYP